MPLKTAYKKLIPIRLRNLLRLKFKSLRQVLYRGDAVSCLCCGGSYARFAPFGAVTPRPNAACPRCDSLERHRFLYYFLSQKTDFFSQKLSVLHFAPEFVLEQLFRSQRAWNYTTADIVDGLADIAFDMQAIPLKNDSLDLIICSHVTSYTDDEPLALRELCRVLKPETGVLLQLTRIHKPTEQSFTGGALDTAARETIYGFDPFVRWLHGRDYPEILRENGFDVTLIAPTDFVTLNFAQKYGFINAENDVFDGETIFLCKKIKKTG